LAVGSQQSARFRNLVPGVKKIHNTIITSINSSQEKGRRIILFICV
jgi:hypothetical protein